MVPVKARLEVVVLPWIEGEVDVPKLYTRASAADRPKKEKNNAKKNGAFGPWTLRPKSLAYLIISASLASSEVTTKFNRNYNKYVSTLVLYLFSFINNSFSISSYNFTFNYIIKYEDKV